MEDTLYLSWRAPAGTCISQINLKNLNRLYYLRRGAQSPKIWQFEALKGGNHLKSQPAPQASGKDNKRPVAIAMLAMSIMIPGVRNETQRTKCLMMNWYFVRLVTIIFISTKDDFGILYMS